MRKILFVLAVLTILSCKKKKDDPAPDPDYTSAITTGNNSWSGTDYNAFPDGKTVKYTGVPIYRIDNNTLKFFCVDENNNSVPVQMTYYSSNAMQESDTEFKITPQTYGSKKIYSKAANYSTIYIASNSSHAASFGLYVTITDTTNESTHDYNVQLTK